MDEVAEWVVHAAQLPQEVANIFRSNSVTGYDFPELAANQVSRRSPRILPADTSPASSACPNRNFPCFRLFRPSVGVPSGLH